MNSYELMSEIGEGMGGIVHLAREKKTGEFKVNAFENCYRTSVSVSVSVHFSINCILGVINFYFRPVGPDHPVD